MRDVTVGAHGLPGFEAPAEVNACGRLNRFGRPSGQNSPCRSFSGIGALIRNGSA